MKKTIINILSIIFSTSMLAQMPTMPKKDKDNFSNNQILTMNDMVFNEAIKPIQKVPLDTNSILIYDYKGVLQSYNLKTDKVNWSTKATDPDRQMSGNKLTLKDGIIYVPFINGEIYALDNQTGKPFWKSRLGNNKEGIIVKNQTPIIEGNHLYIVTQNDNSNIYALNIKDGGIAWNYKVAYPYNHIPVLYFKNKVFTPSAPYFYSFEAKTGKALYQRGFKKAMYGKPVTDGENVFIANESDVLYALNPENLDILWEFQLGKDQFNIKEKIFTKEQQIYFGTKGSANCSVYSVNSKTGKTTWQTDFPEEDIEYITEFENTIWGYTEKGLLFQLDMKTGKRILENQLKNLPVSNLEFVDGNSFYYYCEAGLIQFDIKSKAENSVLLRNSIDDNAGDAFIKLIR